MPTSQRCLVWWWESMGAAQEINSSCWGAVESRSAWEEAWGLRWD